MRIFYRTVIHSRTKSCTLVRDVLNKYYVTIAPIKMGFSKLTPGNKSDEPPIVFMHGFLETHQDWAQMSQYLSEKTKRVIYNVDARNHGKSPRSEEHAPGHLAADILHLLKEENIQQASFVGHNMGGQAMMIVALQNPNVVEKAVFIDSSLYPTTQYLALFETVLLTMMEMDLRHEVFLEKTQKIVGRMMIELFENMHIAQIVVNNLKKNDKGHFQWISNVASLYENLILYWPNVEFEATPINSPVLFIGVKDSRFLNEKDWPKIQKKFTNAKLKWIKSSPMVFTDQNKMLSLFITNFLNNQADEKGDNKSE